MVGNIFETNYDFEQIEKITKLAGVTFENRQDIIMDLKLESDVVLMRDYKNEYDKNAIKVLTNFNKEQIQIGWIPRDLASVLAPEIDAGIIWKGKIYKIIGTEYKNKGILIELEYIA